jgi:hypothetical protein
MSAVIHHTEGLIQTVRIEGRFSSGKISVGTGFQYAFLVKKLDEKRRRGVRAIVTIRHVIENQCGRNITTCSLLANEEVIASFFPNLL